MLKNNHPLDVVFQGKIKFMLWITMGYLLQQQLQKGKKDLHVQEEAVKYFD